MQRIYNSCRHLICVHCLFRLKLLVWRIYSNWQKVNFLFMYSEVFLDISHVKMEWISSSINPW